VTHHLNANEKLQVYNTIIEGRFDLFKTLILEKKFPLFEEISMKDYMWTPLHYAAYQDDYALVEVILLRGGSKLVLEHDVEGFTPLQTARNHNERPACEHLLLQAAEKARGKT